ncbi:TonB-dependent receptor domain-containing protein [Larkinella sp. VNQ87]|uniref:TonB-dependent receptor domain-containing protein n=1 Tax=Larkinella sp. VNQ87 TaxID=3400921 RepID=UPI003BFFDA7C
MAVLVFIWLEKTQATAQPVSTGQINGRVEEAPGQPLPLVTVRLHNMADSTLLKGVVADERGAFVLSSVPPDTYYVVLSLLGYETYTSRPLTVLANRNPIDLGVIRLVPEVRQVAEVQVVARRPFIEQDAEKTILNVSNSLVSTGGTALEVLEKAPGVEIDYQSNQISLRGKQGLLILINGKPTNLSAQELASFLQALSSATIDRIEIMPNPPARFDASGNAGVINIRLKKEQGAGLNGSLTGGVGYGETAKYNAAGTFNYRNRTLNVYANADWNHNPWHIYTNFRRLINHPRGLVVVDQYNDWYLENASRSANAGLDWTLSRRTTLGTLVTWTSLGSDQLSKNRTLMQSQNRTDSVLTNRGDINGGTDRYLFNLNVKHVFDSTNRPRPPAELTFDADYSPYQFTRRNTYEGNYAKPDGTVLTPFEYRSYAPTTITLASVRADFLRPLTKSTTVELGYKSTWLQSRSDVLFEELKGERWKPDPRFSLNFRYRETTQAGYVNFRTRSRGWEIQAGLRAEHTQSVAEALETENRVVRDYLNLFPSLFITRKLSDKQQVQVSYSRRIDRPTYQEMNPNVEFQTPILFHQGNPFLVPQYTKNALLTHTYGSVVTSLGYSDATDAFVWVAEQNDLTFEQRNSYTNARRFQNVSLTTTVPWSPVRGWTTSNSLSLYQNRYAIELSAGLFQSVQNSLTVRSTHTFSLPDNWTLELSGFYNSPRTNGFFQVKHQSQVSVAVQHQFWQKRATFRLNLTDLFYGNVFRNTIRYENLHVNNYARRETRQIRATLSYRFGSQQVKAARSRTTSSTEDQQRL